MRIFAMGLLLLVWGCASSPPLTAQEVFDARPASFASRVTVTGNDVPGPLVVRELTARFNNGTESVEVGVGDPLMATVDVWFNGNGQFIAHWERNGEVIDRIRVYVTYGEFLRVELDDPAYLPTTRPGRHALRFVMENPVAEGLERSLTYEVVSSYR